MYPAESVALSGLRCLSSSATMGAEPTAAARCSAYWPRLSRTRAEAGGETCSSSLRARSRFVLEATKWRTVWPALSGECGARVSGAGKDRLAWEGQGWGTLLVHVGAFGDKEVDDLVCILDAGSNHEGCPAGGVADVWVEGFKRC